MSQSESTKVPWASLAVVATFVSGTLIVPKAFDLLRPPEKERAQQFSGADLEVDARLWEDPFGAVRRHEMERTERCKNPAAATKRECDVRQRDERRSPQALRTHLDGNGDGRIDAESTLLIAVLVPGNPFVGAEEARRRTRFALLSGLQAEGYFPDSAEQIGLMQVPLAPIAAVGPLTQLTSSPATRTAAAAPAASAAASSSAESSSASAGPVLGGDMLQMPYELLSRSRNVRASEDAPAAAAAARTATHRAAAASASEPAAATAPATATAAPAATPEPYQRVAVVWVDEAALPGPKLDGVARLLDTVMACREQVCPRLAVVGPSSSDGLNLMLHGLEAALARRIATPQAIDAVLANGYRLLGRAHYLAPGATISDEDLPLLRRYGYSVQEFFTAYFTGIVPERASMGAAEREVRFQRTIGADNTVATLLAGEVLQRLPTTDKRRVVTIVESDSIYARGLEQRMRHLLIHGSQVSRIDQAYFFRGIDGVTSRDGAGDRPPPSTKSKSDADAVEWPEARDQLDYLRRMAEELKASESIDADKGGGPIGAIGIFANDVHDKLLVLQALHDTFPDKVFFTTDMDARYVHPRVLPFTRNLVVASSLPLKMPPLLNARADGELVKGTQQVQEGTPPLRDVYQTATYLSARLAACTSSCEAVRGAMQDAIQSPSVYEIGRSAAVPITGYDAAMQRLQRPGAGMALILAVALTVMLVGLALWPGTPALRQMRERWPSTPGRASAANGAVTEVVGGSTSGPATDAAATGARRPPRTASLLIALYGLWFGFAAASIAETAAPGSLGLNGALVWAALGAAVGAWLSPTGRALIGGTPAAPRSRRLLHLGTMVMLASALALAWAVWEAGQPGQGEPLRWLEGISGWPSHFLHLLAFLVVLVSLDLAWHRAAEVMRAESEWLAWQPPEAPELTTLARSPTWPQRVRAWLHRHALLSSPLPAPGSVDFRAIWRRFQQVNEPAPRFVRVLFWYGLTVAGAALLFVWLTGRYVPEVPVRGAEHRAIILTGLIAALAALPALVLAVADATLATCRLLLALGRGRTVYPLEVVARFAREFGPEHAHRFIEPLAATPQERHRQAGDDAAARAEAAAKRADEPGPGAAAPARRADASAHAPAPPAASNPPPEHSLLDDWIDVQLIARQTQAVAPLIVAPFIVLGLLVAARSRLFDSWAVTWPLALTAALYLLGLVGLAVILKLGAERLRSDALARMRADLLWLTGAGPERAKLVEPMKQLIADVEKNSTGAFAPMLEQPLVAALMVPLGSAGGVQIFDRLLLAR